MPARKPKPQITIASWDEADEHLKILGETIRKREALQLVLNNRLARVREAIKSRLDPLIALERAIPVALEAFAAPRRGDFGEVKTMVLTHGELRFYLPPPSVQPLARKWTWERVGLAIRDIGRCLMASLGLWPRERAEPVNLIHAADIIQAGIGAESETPAARNLLRNGRWFRATVEINREQILADHREGKVTDAELAEIGLRVCQDELFEAKPKNEN